MASSPGALPEDDLQGDTDVEVADSDVESETSAYNLGEWLAGFNAGVDAGRKDVAQAVRAVLGVGAFVDSLLSSVWEKLG